MRRITDASLKLRIYWFYLLLGFIPLLIVSYFSVQAYTQSIQSITDRHVSQMVQQIAEQTGLRCHQVKQDLQQIAELSYIRRFFHEFHNPLQLALFQEKLDQTRSQAGYIHSLALYSNRSKLLAYAAAQENWNTKEAFITQILTKQSPRDLFWQVYRDASGRQILIFARVQAFHNPQRSVGYLVGQVPLKYVDAYLKRLDISSGTTKSIISQNGETLFTLKGRQSLKADEKNLRTYTATIAQMNWQIELSIPEQELFADVRQLLIRTISFTAIIVLLAALASLVFSRRFMRPFDAILHGTQAFAQGDLDHRIAIQKGHEAKRLAQGFNNMADQLKIRQMELIQSNKLAALGLLSAGIAHEIKNPLAGIKTSAQVMADLVSENLTESPNTATLHKTQPIYKNIKDLSNGIVDEVDRLAKITGDLLEFGRPGPSRKRNCRVDKIIDRAINLLQKEINNKQIKVKTQIPEFYAEIDQDQVLQIFINLLLNALSAVPMETGQISIEHLIKKTGETRVSINDNGSGISEDKLTHIFDPFFSLTPGGTGLGLSVVYTLLQQNNIKVDINSRLNEGTTFHLTFSNGNIATEEKRHG